MGDGDGAGVIIDVSTIRVVGACNVESVVTASICAEVGVRKDWKVAATIASLVDHEQAMLYVRDRLAGCNTTEIAVEDNCVTRLCQVDTLGKQQIFSLGRRWYETRWEEQ